MASSLVLLHGFTHTGASWEPVIGRLPERYRALAPDIRGHGSASRRRPCSLEAVIEDLAGEAPDTFTLVGYSMGGRIGLHVALAMPDRIERLLLIGASPGLTDPDERAARRRADERLADEIEGMTIEAFAEWWATNPVLAGWPASTGGEGTVGLDVEGAREFAHRDRVRNTPAGLAAALRGLGTGALPPLWHRLSELAMPVTLIVGERDRKFTDIAHEMTRHIADADVMIVPGAGHVVHLEAPDAVAELLQG